MESQPSERREVDRAILGIHESDFVDLFCALWFCDWPLFITRPQHLEEKCPLVLWQVAEACPSLLYVRLVVRRHNPLKERSMESTSAVQRVSTMQ